jgi:hypothetical protein
MRVHQQIHKL